MPPGKVDPFPPALKPDDFTVITFAAQPPGPQLEPFNFNIATLVNNSETNHQWEVEYQLGVPIASLNDSLTLSSWKWYRFRAAAS